ncbi:MAG: peptidase S41, partial [Sphingobacteriales bacterium]
HNLNLSRLYILTTAATASAAELMINNLRPYMSIIHIGETTRGKDEASITISDRRGTKRVDWVMYPIVYKLYNATGNGNYSTGIVPDRSMIESANLPLQSFGNAADPMINYAIGLINGNATLSSKRSISSLNTAQTQLYNSATVFADNAPLVTAH